jgi:hypothetical protein
MTATVAVTVTVTVYERLKSLIDRKCDAFVSFHMENHSEKVVYIYSSLTLSPGEQ